MNTQYAAQKRLCLRISWVGAGLALMALATAAAAGFGSRIGLWHFRTGFVILHGAAWGGAGSALLALAGGICSLRRHDLRGLALALVAASLGTAVLVVPLSWKLAAGQVPRIHDITTDTYNPPRFVAILPLRKVATNTTDYGGADVAQQQHTAYPDIKTAILPFSSKKAFALALETARDMGWEIVAAVADEGRIEATDTTFWFGFTDDIVIRITPDGERAILDIRSLSRVGVSDVGTNARRIRTFLARLTDSD